MALVGGISATVVRLILAPFVSLFIFSGPNEMALVGGISATVIRLALTHYMLIICCCRDYYVVDITV